MPKYGALMQELNTPLKKKNRKKRREKYRRKTIPGLPVDLNKPKLSKAERSRIANEIFNAENLAEIQHKSPIIWVVRNIQTEKGEPMEFKDRPYLVDIYRDFHPDINVKKGAQIGLTQLSICKCLYVSDRENMTSIYTFPTATAVNDFSKSRFKTIMDQSAYLRTRIKNYDSHGYREIGNSKIYFKGATSESQAISIPADLLIHDELDFSDPEVIDFYAARLSVSRWKWKWNFSTPTLPEYGIDRIWKDTDRHVWIVKCPRCNLYQTIDFFKNLKRRKEKGGEKRWFFGCRKCDRQLDRRKGNWRALAPEKELRGYFVPQEICPVISAKYMRDEYKKAQKNGNMKKFYNFNLGRAYETGETKLTRQNILNHVVPSTLEQGPILIGADQGDILHVVVKKLTDRMRTIWIGKVQDIPEFAELLNHYSRHSNTVAVLDALPNHSEALRYANARHNLYLCYYSDTGKIEQDEIKEEAQKSKELHIKRTDALDHTAHLWRSDGMLIESGTISPLDIEEFADQMTNMKRDLVEDKRTHNQKAVWVKTGPDHYRHADLYSWVAQQLFSASNSEELVSDEDVFVNEHENLFEATTVW